MVSEEARKADYPYIVFKIKGDLFAIKSKNVTSIMQLPGYVGLPQSGYGVQGVFIYRGKAATLLNFRKMLGKNTMDEEYAEFAAMLDQRKQDHINWVAELERTVKNDEKFTLATDPHKCAFGKWYDSYKSDGYNIMFHMKKIKEPHDNLHMAAHKVEKCKRDCKNCPHKRCLREILMEVKDVYMANVLQLLDEAKTIFKDEYREMVLMVGEERPVGIMVDEVLAVETLDDTVGASNERVVIDSPYILGLKESRSMNDIIFEIDENTVTGLN